MLTIGVDRPILIQYFSRALTEILEDSRFDEARSFYEIPKDIPYVAGTMTDSIQSSIGHQGLRRFWTFRDLQEVRTTLIRGSDCPEDPFAAKLLADQVLLLLGFRFFGNRGSPLRLIPDVNIAEIQKTGQVLYEIAGEGFPIRDERPTLLSMSQNFVPWTEALALLEAHEKTDKLLFNWRSL